MRYKYVSAGIATLKRFIPSRYTGLTHSVDEETITADVVPDEVIGRVIDSAEIVQSAHQELDDETPFGESQPDRRPFLDDFGALLPEKDITNLWMMIMYNFPSHCGEKMTREASDIFKEMSRVYELHRQAIENEQVYCTECNFFKYENDLLSCVNEKKCHFWDTEDSRPRRMRPFWTRKEIE